MGTIRNLSETFEVIEIHLASFFIGRCYCVLSVNGSIEMFVEAMVQLTFDLTSVGAVPSRGALGHSPPTSRTVSGGVNPNVQWKRLM